MSMYSAVLSTVRIKQSSNYGYSVLIMVYKRLSTQQLVKSSVVGVSLNYVHSPLPHQSTRVTHHHMSHNHGATFAETTCTITFDKFIGR